MSNPFQQNRIIFLILLCGTAIMIWIWILLHPNPKKPTQRPAEPQAFLSDQNRA